MKKHFFDSICFHCEKVRLDRKRAMDVRNMLGKMQRNKIKYKD